MSILEEVAESSGLKLFEVIRQTLIHEIGHHFGLDDEEIEKIFEEKWEAE
ncbi:MAG: metallopeptidase family protein [Patescibacteria group bacterium]